jgi:hypothetical protein
MRFAHVDGQKIGVIFVVVENLDDVADLATKRRSSIAAENNHQRAATDALVYVELICTVESEQWSIGSGVAGLEFAAVHIRQGIAEHEEGVLGAARHHGQGREACDQEDAEAGGEP